MIRKLTTLCVVAVIGCASPEGKGLKETGDGTGAKVTFDVHARPLPNIPLPNDFATRFDPNSPTKKRVNASMEAPTKWERATRETLDQLDGWGTYQSVTVAFEKPLDLLNLVRRHQGDDYEPSNDAVYLINITPDSPQFCERTPLDMGEGNFPIVLERPDYFDNDRNGDQLLFDDRDEDANRNGKLDLGEDLDMDGVLDKPNVLTPGDGPFKALTFYERETNTLIMKPVMPLNERTVYAVVLTTRLVDEEGRPVRSPFAYVNHTSQTNALKPLEQCLPKFGLGLDDLAFTWSYTTQSVTDDYVTIRDGLYGIGPMSRLAIEFPGVISKILPLKDQMGSGMNVRIVKGDDFRSAALDLLKQLEGGTLSPTFAEVAEHHKFIDYHIVFQFEAPQFFRRVDAEGNPLPLYKQLFDVNAQTGAAFTRSETMTVWVTMPKARPAGGGPVPVVILGHGYTGNKLDPLFYGGFLARYGMATIGMENVSHGVGLDPTDLELARALLASKGLGNMFDAIAKNDRAFDQNRDGKRDSGADFWTAYILHTREVVKQSALDYMQLVRVLRGFDGVQRSAYDANQDGQKDLAGDFDGDGQIDIGGTAPIHIMGGSLGGIMSAMMSGLEPQIDVAVPVSGGAGLPDIGVRSIQGGVREAVNLRMLGPILSTVPNGAGELELWQVLPDLNDLGRVKLGKVGMALVEGDTAVITNKTTGEIRCHRVGAQGRVRAVVSSDEGDEWVLNVYSGPLPAKERDGCFVPEGTEPYFTFDTVQETVTFQGLTHEAGTPLKALGDGFGLRRQSPELRRFLGLAQMAIEKGDPVNFLPNAERHRVLRYGTGEEVSTRMLVVNTIGDMNVPVATGASVARAAGLIDLYGKDQRYGKTPNRVLIDNGVIEAVERTGRYKNSSGGDVLMDIDHFSALSGDGTQDLFDVPRLAPPLRLVKPSERVGGITGAIFPMVTPTGRHGFDTPDPTLPFNLGAVMLNMLGRYMSTGGAELPMEGCLESSSCSFVPPFPTP
ncbi:MAG: hypothetical protein DI536_07570 [Archangium gephyra]|uniref:Lipoprotein n=1 Tax=Archangium gephyra TaxID=48 RepID=A0A2W5TKN2_9BACT|nr:MAG: hypothetical protein DI536_07570 [Archangium gephyra]